MTFDDRRRAFCAGYVRSALEQIANGTHTAPSNADYAAYTLAREAEFKSMTETEFCQFQGWRLGE